MGFIYQIRNLENNKIYVGSAVDFTRRTSWHKCRLNKNKHYNDYLQRAWNKYGEENFKFEIIEVLDKSCLIEREQHYLDTLKPEYNVSTSATGGNLGPEVGRKLSILKRGNRNNLGKKFSEEHKRKIGEANKGKRLGMKASEETKRKMSESGKRRKHFPLSEEIRQKIGLSLVGNVPWNKGKTGVYSKETLEKISNTQKLRLSKNKEKINGDFS
jgi:group I intron endonuclease